MKNVKLYEEFTGNIIPKESDLAKEISEILDITDDFRKRRRENKFSFYVPLLGDRFSIIEKVKDLIKFLRDNNYKIETFPILSEMSLKTMTLQIRADLFNPFKNLDYGINILVDCVHDGQKYKACINITSTGFSYEMLGKEMETIATKEFDPDLIDILFWNGEYLVTGKFEYTDTYTDAEEKTTLDFESYETSDGKDYIMYARATISGDEVKEMKIKKIDFN